LSFPRIRESIQKIKKTIILFFEDFEVHPFKKENFEEGNPFIQYINENSIKIA
jgi:hypothetical protein